MATITEQLKLQTWLSPAFPVGAFSYSHGLEWAVEAALVADRATLVDWIEGLLAHGTGRIDAMLFAAAWRAEGAALDEVAALAAAFRGTRELALETAQQGEAFAKSVGVGWGAPPPAAAYPVAVGAACRAHGLALETALPLFVQAFAANLVSAGVRLIPLGQSDGLRALAALEVAVREAAQDAMTAPLDDLGAAAPMLDWCSMRHETQYTRLFRS
jgi:urease accessory protein